MTKVVTGRAVGIEAPSRALLRSRALEVLSCNLGFVGRQRDVIAVEFGHDRPLLQSGFMRLNLARGPRSTPELKVALEQGLNEILSVGGGDRKEAIFQTAALLGDVVVARAVRDQLLSDEILESIRQKLG